ncbi:asparagine synthase-related protein [Haloechinothrix alba]|uniref:asparagine synthase-related protein n=1 Tax=Haloechinothrix alba TaxID=664784 RepID=UPI000B772860|nr:asparagine synthase-related protein [Haloechinothrix alba]
MDSDPAQRHPARVEPVQRDPSPHDQARVRVCGSLGHAADERVTAMSTLLGDPPTVLDRPTAALRGTATIRWNSPGAEAASWSPTPLPEKLPADARHIAAQHDAFSLVVPDSGDPYLHAGISGAAPVYVDTAGEPTGGAHGTYLCSHVEPLARTRRGPLRPDWDAWAQILAMGGPLEGRTPFAGIRRLPPYARLTATAGGACELSTTGWPWPEVTSSSEASLDTVRDALTASVGALGERARFAPLLSGGWDSRILTTLAARTECAGLTAWTTSSDTGTVLEELVSAQVAGTLGIEHAIVPARRDRFSHDLAYFTEAVEHQTSFHVWLVPLATALAGNGATVLDGLGGGVFLGGAFPDSGGDGPVLDRRFSRMAKYLDAVGDVLHPNVAGQVAERTRASFDTVAEPLADHPYGNTFTAYLTRTLPGISLSPFGLLSRGNPVATPFLDDSVVRAALAIPHAEHAEGSLYAPLLRPLAPELAELPTAAEIPQARRHHRRRVASPEAAERFRELLSREPVRGLLAPGFAAASTETWRRMLDRTNQQHLIRSLATMSLWFQRYEDLLGDVPPDELREPVT